jgi:hypothetical protein
MPQGYDRDANVVNLGDTARLEQRARDNEDNLYTFQDITRAEFIVQKPDGNQTTFNADVEEDGTATFNYPDTDQMGEYIVVCRFYLDDGQVQSVRTDFEAVDPFMVDAPDPVVQKLVDAVWMRFEDLFDSEDGGPWLRDMSMRYFNKEKIVYFIDDALLEINYAPPATNATLADFVSPLPPASGADPDMPIMVQGVTLAVIRHLIRSYAEQPRLVGANIAWQDRTSYFQTWQSIYQVEHDTYARWLALWKRQFLGFGHSALLVGSKAGRLIPAPMRTRYVGRGYY